MRRHQNGGKVENRSPILNGAVDNFYGLLNCELLLEGGIAACPSGFGAELNAISRKKRTTQMEIYAGTYGLGPSDEEKRGAEGARVPEYRDDLWVGFLWFPFSAGPGGKGTTVPARRVETESQLKKAVLFSFLSRPNFHSPINSRSYTSLHFYKH